MLALLPWFLCLSAAIPLAAFWEEIPAALAVGAALAWVGLNVGGWVLSLVAYLRWVPLIRR
jgi:hypothetical protein